MSVGWYFVLLFVIVDIPLAMAIPFYAWALYDNDG